MEYEIIFALEEDGRWIADAADLPGVIAFAEIVAVVSAVMMR